MHRRFALLLTVMLTSPAIGQVTVWPKQSTLGAHEKYVVRVANEKQSDTVSIEIRFPAGARVTAFEQKPGWYTEPVHGSNGAVAGVRWSGKLPASQFAEFGLLAVNPVKGKELVWTAVQTYADGSKVQWNGPAGSNTASPRVALGPGDR